MGYTVVGIALSVACLVSDWRQVSVDAMVRSEKQQSTVTDGQTLQNDADGQQAVEAENDDEEEEDEEAASEEQLAASSAERWTRGEKTTEGRLERGEEEAKEVEQDEDEEAEEEEEVEEVDEEDEEEEEEVEDATSDEVVDVDMEDGEEYEVDEDDDDDDQPGSAPKSPGLLLSRHQQRSEVR